VVDPQLKVYGVYCLRVADGSIMPAISSANTHTTIVMSGERAAEFIKAERYPGGRRKLTRRRPSTTPDPGNEVIARDLANDNPGRSHGTPGFLPSL
jgi:hypothetical protein